MSVRTDTSNLPLRWLITAYGWVVGVLLLAQYLIQRPFVRIKVSGRENLRSAENAIYCCWHEYVSIALQTQIPRVGASAMATPQDWLQHPIWYMKPIHVLLRLAGVRNLILGSTGHGGREAADRLASNLANGASTLVLPDGPGGPRRHFYKGVLHLSKASGVPIVPIRFKVERCLRTRTWDRKYWPLPGTKVSMYFCEPVFVEAQSLDVLEEQLCEAMGEL